MNEKETIAAIATGLSHAGISMIRISGENAIPRITTTVVQKLMSVIVEFKNSFVFLNSSESFPEVAESSR